MSQKTRWYKTDTFVAAVVTGCFGIPAAYVAREYYSAQTPTVINVSQRNVAEPRQSAPKSHDPGAPPDKLSPRASSPRSRSDRPDSQPKDRPESQPRVVIAGQVQGPISISQGQRGGQTAGVINNIFSGKGDDITFPLAPDDPCPEPDPTDPGPPKIRLEVYRWCHSAVYNLQGDLLPDQVQVKIRPSIINSSEDTIAIGLAPPSPFRLLVVGKDIGERWTPPMKTEQAGDRPVLIEFALKTYWGIPPNQVRDAYPTSAPYYTGFAASWDGTFLTPGQSYIHPIRRGANNLVIREGNLVFQVPVTNNRVELAGLALVSFHSDGTLKVIALARRNDWPPPTNPTSF